MQESSAEKAVGLTSYIFKLPSTNIVIALSFIVSLLLAISFSFSSLWLKKEVVTFDSFLVLFIPLLILSFILTLVFSFLVSIKSRKMKFKQVLATYIAANIVLSIFLLLSFLGIEFAAIGIGLVCTFWFLIARLVFGQVYKAPLISGLYFVFQVPLAFLAFLSMQNVVLFVIDSLIASIVFLIGLQVIFWLINAPVKRIFGVTGISLVSMFFEQWLRRTKGLEDIFAKFADTVKTNVDVICFRKTGGRGKEEFAFIIPHLHYGPFGNLGGSEFPHLIAHRLRTIKYNSTFVFHGTATHDFNPIRSNDVEKIVHSVKDALKEIKFESEARIITGRWDQCSVSGLASKKAGFCMLTHAPKVTEDIDFSVGLALRSHAEKFVDKAVIIDAHNAETGELMHVESGSPLFFDYQLAIENAFKEKRAKYGKLELGVSSFYPKVNSMGHAGIKVALFKIEKRKFCIILIDANGITPGFRNRILLALRDKGIEGEVCTTDTHAVNVVRGVINPIGAGMSDYEIELLIHDITDTVKKAEKDLSRVEFGIESKTVEIDVFGPKRAAELVGTANSIAAVLKWAAPAILFACGIASYIIIRVI